MTTTSLPTVIEILGPPEEFEPWDEQAWEDSWQHSWDDRASWSSEAREVLFDLLDKAKARGYGLAWVAAQVSPSRLPPRAKRLLLRALAEHQAEAA